MPCRLTVIVGLINHWNWPQRGVNKGACQRGSGMVFRAEVECAMWLAHDQRMRTWHFVATNCFLWWGGGCSGAVHVDDSAQGRIQDFGQGGTVEFWNPGGPEPKNLGFFPLNCLKNAWFWNNLWGKGAGPPGSASDAHVTRASLLHRARPKNWSSRQTSDLRVWAPNQKPADTHPGPNEQLQAGQEHKSMR